MLMHFHQDICVDLAGMIIVVIMGLIIANSHLEVQWKKRLRRRLAFFMLL